MNIITTWDIGVGSDNLILLWLSYIDSILNLLNFVYSNTYYIKLGLYMITYVNGFAKPATYVCMHTIATSLINSSINKLTT